MTNHEENPALIENSKPSPLKAYKQRLLAITMVFLYLGTIEYFWGWEKLISTWTIFPLYIGLISLFMIFISYTIRAVRLYAYFPNETKQKIHLCIKLIFYHNYFNNILPVRSGELSFPILMSRYFQVDIFRSTSALLWFRLLDLHAVLSLGFIAVLISGQISLHWAWFLVLWLLAPLFFDVVHKKFAYFLSQRKKTKLTDLALKLLNAFPQSMHTFWYSWVLTWINWVVKIVALAWILLQFLPMPVPAAIMGVLAGDLTSVLPIHAPAGLGTYEAGVVAGLTPWGLTAKDAFLAAVNLHLVLLFATSLSGLLALIIPQKTYDS